MSAEGEEREFSGIHLLSFTDRGQALAGRVREILVGRSAAAEVSADRGVPAAAWTAEHFCQGQALIFVGAAGIAVRMIGPLLRDKYTDPAVLVIDEAGQFVIPLLSGHVGGANALAGEIAGAIGAVAVITTASDVHHLFAVDVFAKRNGLLIGSRQGALDFAAGFLRERKAGFAVDERLAPLVHISGPLPQGLIRYESAEQLQQRLPAACPRFVIGPAQAEGPLVLTPRLLVVGMGCRRGVSQQELLAFLQESLSRRGYCLREVGLLTSIDRKRDEPGLIALARHLQVPFETFPAQVLMEQEGEFSSSAFVRQTTGADNVCERSAAVRSRELVIPRQARDGMTLAVGLREITVRF